MLDWTQRTISTSFSDDYNCDQEEYGEILLFGVEMEENSAIFAWLYVDTLGDI
ncbi:2757_t:CDS:1, partial [Funneliformis geosporum]